MANSLGFYEVGTVEGWREAETEAKLDRSVLADAWVAE